LRPRHALRFLRSVVDSWARARYVCHMLLPLPKLRPFFAHIDRGDGKPMIVIEGRILPSESGDVYSIRAFGSQATLLPVQVESDTHGKFARIAPGEHRFDNGLVLDVRKRAAKAGREAARASAGVELSLCSESPAMPSARPLFGKLGGDPRLVRLIAPSSWAIGLSFDAEGRYLAEDRRVC
jgi:hypothetical protein